MDRDFFSTISLKDAGREHAMEQAKFLGVDAWGMVPTRFGWGVRVRSARYDELAKRLRPDDYKLITGKVFEISGLPTWVCEDALAEFLGPTTKLLEVRGTKKIGHKENERRTYFVKTEPEIITFGERSDCSRVL
jgi:hypothetical protein